MVEAVVETVVEAVVEAVEEAARLAVVETILQAVVHLDQIVQLFDDDLFDVLQFALNVAHVGDVALRFDVKLRPVGAQVGVAHRSWNGNHTTSSDAVVAHEEAHLLDGVRAHVQVVMEDDVLGRSRSAL